MRRIATALAGLILGPALLLPAQGLAQAPAQPAGEVSVRDGKLRVIGADPYDSSTPYSWTISEQGGFYIVTVVSFARVELSAPPPCALSSMDIFIEAQCQGPVRSYLATFGEFADRIRISGEVPRLPGKSKLSTGKGDDKIDGGRSGERIDPGPGKDKVNAGKGPDRIDARDGQPDEINGGKGPDKATVDKKLDKVKNVEKVKRR